MTLNEPVIGQDFFGRTEALDLIKKRVSALKEGYRQNVALTGQNLSGKTSILHNFLYTFRDREILPIYVEITDEPFSYFTERFIGSLLFNFLKIKGHQPTEDLELLIEGSRNYMPRAARCISRILELVKKRDLNEAYSELFDLTSLIKEETGISCVIILDEFHNLGSLKVKHPFKNFGKKIMIQKDTMYIVTSSQVSTVKRILNEKLSLLFGNFEIVNVEGFASKNASSFLDARFKYLRVPKEYRDFIISFTDGNPFYLDIISQSLKDIVTDLTFKRVTRDVLVCALKNSIFNSKGSASMYLASILEGVRQKKGSTETYIPVLLAVAGGSYRMQDISRAVRKRTGDVTKCLTELVDMNILYKNGSFYKFVDKMFGFWLKFVYKQRRSAIISYLPDRIEAFKDQVGRLIDSFIAEESKDITQRTADLLGLFNNETACIHDKEYRLPHFSSIDIKPFGGSEVYISMKAKKKDWVVYVCTDEVKDIDIIEFTEKCRSLAVKPHNKILITLAGTEMNARLLAKEEKIWIWGLDDLNRLKALYGKEKIVGIRHRTRKKA